MRFIKLKVWLFSAILLLSSSIAYAQKDFLSASVNKSADNRVVIWVTESERVLFLTEMRELLMASQAILEASLDDDMDRVETVARKMGIKMLKGTPKSLTKKFPAGFIKLGPKTHLGFEAIADESASLGDKIVILKQLANLQKSCIACHAAYRLNVQPLKCIKN